MSIAARGQTRARAEAMVAYLRAHEDFAALIEEDLLEVIYNPSAGGKSTLDVTLEKRVAKIKGLLVTVTPTSGRNVAKGLSNAGNETNFAVNCWSRPRLEDSRLPDPLDFIDEVQRVLHGWSPAYADGRERHSHEAAKVSAWVEVPDTIYLNHEVQVTALVPLGKATA